MNKTLRYHIGVVWSADDPRAAAQNWLQAFSNCLTIFSPDSVPEDSWGYEPIGDAKVAVSIHDYLSVPRPSEDIILCSLLASGIVTTEEAVATADVLDRYVNTVGLCPSEER